MTASRFVHGAKDAPARRRHARGMKLVIGIVRPDKANEVLEALYRAEVRGFSMSRVQGHGGELDRVETYRGTTVRVGLTEKVRFEIAVSDDFVAPDHVGLSGVAFEPREGQTIPHLLFMAFQATFCIIPTALVAGAVVERMRFGAFLVFAALWSVLVYAVLAHWAFGGGWLIEGGTLDFAGGVPVEMASGFSALAAALVVGARKDYGRQALLPHNAIYVLLGAGLLWFGGFVSPGWALALGALGALPCYAMIVWRPRTRVDETLDVLAAHGIAGFTGILAIGFVAQASWNGVSDGLIYGNGAQLVDQILAAVAAPTYAFAATYVLLKVIGALMPLRVTDAEEA